MNLGRLYDAQNALAIIAPSRAIKAVSTPSKLSKLAAPVSESLSMHAA